MATAPTFIPASAYPEVLIFGSRAPNMDEMRAGFRFPDFQSLDATEWLPRGCAKALTFTDGSVTETGYTPRLY